MPAIQLEPCPLPVVTGISPGSATEMTAGTTVVVSGDGFSSGAFVSLIKSDDPLKVISMVEANTLSRKQIQAKLSLGKEAVPGIYHVKVTNWDGQSATGTSLFEVKHRAPSITEITPVGGTAGNISVPFTITGNNIHSGATVTLIQHLPPPFGIDYYIDATNVQVIDLGNKQTISGIFDLESAFYGDSDIQVSNPDNQISILVNGFHVYQPMQITSVVPNRGRSKSVIHITNISGVGFQPGAMVTLRVLFG